MPVALKCCSFKPLSKALKFNLDFVIRSENFDYLNQLLLRSCWSMAGINLRQPFHFGFDSLLLVFKTVCTKSKIFSQFSLLIQ